MAKVKTNPDKIGEFQKFYYIEGDTDITTATATDQQVIDLPWNELCIVNLDLSQSFTEHVFNDTCSADVESVAPGRKQLSMSFEVNTLRHSDADIIDWQILYDTRQVICVLAFTGEKEANGEYGFVGNWIFTQADESRPQEGPMTESYTLRPAARSVYDPLFRRIYGQEILTPTPPV